MIRYRTSDVASFACPPQNYSRPYKLLENVSGRIQDYIISSNGSYIPIAPALFDYNFDWSGIDRFQLEQTRKGNITFNFISSENNAFSDEELEERLIHSFGKILHNTFSIEAKAVKSIPFTNRGKYRYVNQKIKNDKSEFIKNI